MKKIEVVKKVTTKWVKADLKAETVKKVQSLLRQENATQDKTITQREFLDGVILKGLEA